MPVLQTSNKVQGLIAHCILKYMIGIHGSRGILYSAAKKITRPESEPALKQIAGLRQVWKHISTHNVLTQEAIPKEGGQLKKLASKLFNFFFNLISVFGKLSWEGGLTFYFICSVKKWEILCTVIFEWALTVFYKRAGVSATFL